MDLLYLLPIALSVVFVIVGAVALKRIKRNYLDTVAAKAQKEVAAITAKVTDAENALNLKLKELEALYQSRSAELTQSYESRRKVCDEIIAQTEARRKALQQSIDDSKSSIDRELASFREMRLTQIRSEVETEARKRREAAVAQDEEFYLAQEETRAAYVEETQSIKDELDAYRAKRDALNAEIMRQRELEEKQDFYRVCLSAEAKEDIELLGKVREKLNYRENLSKLIYDNYVAAAAKEMVKRVLGGKAPSGIYKITRINTGEVYIGKSTDVSARFISHIKTACGVACIASSTLHTTMARDGVDCFTFELLEEVEKSQLTEREKYWITFYNSDKMGLNQKVG